MTDKGRALVYLGTHNEVDHISPIIYKIGERGNIDVDVVLEWRVDLDDYRIQAIDQYDGVNIFNSQPSAAQRATKLAKKVDKKIPTKIPKKIYKSIVKSKTKKSSDALLIPKKLSGHDYDIVAFDWTHAHKKKTTHFENDEETKTIVLPHGDSPYINAMQHQNLFDRFVDDRPIFGRKFEQMLKHDCMCFPNKLTSERIPQDTSGCQVEVLGSPRYNYEWLNVLKKIRPKISKKSEDKINAVLFLRMAGYFISKNEVVNTLKLMEKFEKVDTIVKEHPRTRLLSTNVSDGMESVEIVKDEISSSSLIGWGDIFLSLGTTITFEPIMRREPVLSVEYAHANYTVVSDFFPRSDMRTKDDLYHTIRSLIADGTKGFYDNRDHKKFEEEMISPIEKPVLDSWAEFIESKC